MTSPLQFLKIPPAFSLALALTFGCIPFNPKQTPQYQILQKIQKQLQSPNQSTRKYALQTLKQQKIPSPISSSPQFLSFINTLQNTLHNPSKHISEKNLAAQTLFHILQKNTILLVPKLLSQTQNPSSPQSPTQPALVILNLYLQKYPFPKSQPSLYPSIPQILSKFLQNHTPKPILKNIAQILGKIKSTKNLPQLLQLLQNPHIIEPEITSAIALLGTPKTNPLIKKTFLKLASKTQYQPFISALRKGLYILNHSNQTSPPFDHTMMQKLNQLASPSFIAASDAENYFLLFHSTPDILLNTFGNPHTFHPKKIQFIQKYRTPLLILALQDFNPLIRLKAIKLLGKFQNPNACIPLKSQLSKTQYPQTQSLIRSSLHQLRCSI